MIILTKPFYTKIEAANIVSKSYSTVQSFLVRRKYLKAINEKLLIPANCMLKLIKFYRPFDDATIQITPTQDKPNEIY